MKTKTGTSKIGAIPKAQKAQFLKYAQEVFMKNSRKGLKHRKGAFRVRKTLQKFGNSVLGQMGALVFEPPPPL